MISPRLFLLGSTLCMSACMGSGLPTIRPTHSQAMTQETPYERAYNEGKRQLASGRAGLAIVAFERAVRLDPLSVDGLNGIGAAYDELKHYETALGYYKRALLLSPQNTETTNNIAVSMRLAGNPAARDWFERAARLDPSNPVIAANIAQARAEETDHGASPGTVARDVAYVPADTTVDAGAPTLQRSGAAEFQLGLPGGSTITGAPAVTRIDFAVPNVIDRSAPTISTAPSQRSLAPALMVAAASTAPAVASPAATVVATAITVSNCAGRTHMARRFREFFQANDVPVRHIINAPAYDCETSRLLVRAGHEAQGEALARLLPLAIAIETDNAAADEMSLVLGRDLIAFDKTLGERHE
jgi:Tfp pilus assembly protein PilF